MADYIGYNIMRLSLAEHVLTLGHEDKLPMADDISYLAMKYYLPDHVLTLGHEDKPAPGIDSRPEMDYHGE
jgi:hypothetical protein